MDTNGLLKVDTQPFMKDIKNKVQLIFIPNILEGWSGALFWGLYPSLSGIIQNAKRHQYGVLEKAILDGVAISS